MTTIKDHLQARLGLDSKHSKILIVGLGKTGYSIAQFLFAHHFTFAIVDSREQPPYYQHLLEEMPDTPLFLGGFSESTFALASHLLVSPGVSLAEPVIARAINNGAQIVGDIDLFVCAVDAPIVAITGSNGKSTVTTMLGNMASKAKITVAVGGNLGMPALTLIDASMTLYIIELSSFQLERTHLLNADVATVLNISPDHIDRHGNLQTYAYEKSKVYFGDGVKVINADDERVNNMRSATRKELSFGIDNIADFHLMEQAEMFLAHKGKALLAVSQMQVQGRHNIANALAALALGWAAGIPEAVMCVALTEFKGLAHRMQKIAEINGVLWVNDSKATNTSACIAALMSFTRKVILIAGGDSKQVDMQELGAIIQAKVKAAVLIGKDANLIASAIDGAVPAHIVATLNEAVKIAEKLAETGETVLLSPACTSLDQFKNYQERGDQFIQAVQGLQS